mgnify:CR=1 FL=1
MLPYLCRLRQHQNVGIITYIGFSGFSWFWDSRIFTNLFLGHFFFQTLSYLPAVSCELTTAPWFSNNSVILAIPCITSGSVISGLKLAVMCRGVSLSRWVVMFTSALFLIRKPAENSSPVMKTALCINKYKLRNVHVLKKMPDLVLVLTIFK